MRFRTLIRRLSRLLPEPPPDEIVVRWVEAVDPNAPAEEIQRQDSADEGTGQ